MANCQSPGEVFESGRTLQAWGELVEHIVQKDYCNALTQQGLGVCALFIPPTLGGARSEFFDEDAGVHRCDLLASYLKFHNSSVNEQAVVDQCRATNPKPLRVKVPDIISTRFARTEFYEIKPNSNSGKLSGAEKIAWFNVLCSPTVLNLPYKAGTQYKPNFIQPMTTGNILGAPFQVGVHVFWFGPGLILHEICPVTNRPRQEEKCGALMRASALAAIVRLRADPASAAATLEALIPVAESPLQEAVGEANAAGAPAPNILSDVMYVQLLLNDWRGRNDLPLIAEDGLVGPETNSAIEAFQQAVTGIVDGRIDVNGPAIQALEQGHIRSLFDATEATIATLSYPTATDPIIYHDTDDEGNDDADEPIAPADLLAAMQEEMQGYLQLLYE